MGVSENTISSIIRLVLFARRLFLHRSSLSRPSITPGRLQTKGRERKAGEKAGEGKRRDKNKRKGRSAGDPLKDKEKRGEG
jgi:hypothetical protein